ncbi:MAG: energy transducer TonB [Pseudomonadota bacterium]|uniref:energy transducer TonB n=1 Tax=Phenylobacterium sp. TaxID=1871053 RepID=UPI0025DA137D|nr:energy transducer TonB [Phenylobacterium sp.]MBT9470292.1 energy transducer TonB [Phenylobacterium sp.]
MKLTRTRVTAAAVSTAFNVELIALVMRTGADAPPVWDETVVIAELVQVRGGETHAPNQSAQAPSSPPREPAPAPPVPNLTLPQALPDSSRPAAPSPPSNAAAAPPAIAVSTAAASTTSAAPQRAGTREGLDIDAQGGASLDYASRLRAWLEAHKTYPKRARMRREEGVVHVQFAVDREGRLLRGDVVHSSGFASLDAEAMAMLDRSNPFPGAPHTVRGERIEVRAPVEFFLTR